jgi:hypothetical protein
LAVLSGAARAVITAHIQRPQQVFGALVDATDQWIDDNAAAYNLAIPQPARGALTQQQKTLLFCHVALRRAGLLRAEGE